MYVDRWVGGWNRWVVVEVDVGMLVISCLWPTYISVSLRQDGRWAVGLC